MDSLWMSIKVGAAATLLNLPLAVGLAWVLERSNFKGRNVLQTILWLPLVLPPVVVGFILLKIFSPRGSLGQFLESVGMPVAFHWLGAVLAAAVVGLPLFVMMISLAMKGVESRLEMVSLSLGRSRWQTFWRVTIPLCWPGILVGALLSFARGLGEFGATIILAGRIPGETETLSLRIYAELEAPGGEQKIIGLVCAAVILCLVIVFLARLLDNWHRKRLELDR